MNAQNFFTSVNVAYTLLLIVTLMFVSLVLFTSKKNR